MKTYNKIIAMVAAGIACSAITSQAALAPITVGTSGQAVTGATFTPTGTLLDTLVSPYGPPSNTTDAGTFTTQVYEGNTFGATDLTFIYTIAVTTGDIGSVTVNGFLGTVNIGSTATGSANYNPGFLKFTWGTLNAPNSVEVVVETSSTFYGSNLGSVQDGQTSNVPILAPVPEPTTIAAGALMLLPFGIGALRSLRKDRVS